MEIMTIAFSHNSKENGVIGAGSVDGVHIKSNMCIASEDINDPLYATPQGYAAF